jgi:hypothetical protein
LPGLAEEPLQTVVNPCFTAPQAASAALGAAAGWARRIGKEEQMFRSPVALALLVALSGLAPLASTAAVAPPQPFITDTLAQGGTAQIAAPFVTDTLATGGAPARSPHFITDTLAPGGGSASPAFVSVSRDGFAWADAGAGAGAVVLAGLLLVTAARVRDRRNAVPV